MRHSRIFAVAEPRDGLHRRGIDAAIDNEAVVDMDADHPPDDHVVADHACIIRQWHQLVQDAFEAPVALASGLSEGPHTVTIALDDSGGELVIGGFLVSRERPMIWPIAVLVAAGLVALFLGLRSLGFLAAEHVGLVQPKSDAPAQTPLPTLPDWKPAPRFQR